MNPDIRNQLAALCRGMPDIEDYLKLTWEAVELAGIHLYLPYLQIDVHLNYTQCNFLEFMPQLYMVT